MKNKTDIFGKIKKDFPILKKKINGKRLVYLDSAATSLKPRSVIEAVDLYYKNYSANIFRGIYKISEKATEEYEKVRVKTAKFINAKKPEEIVFVRNTTEAINMVAYSWGRLNINSGDEIVVTIMEHHSNFVPWQKLAGENGAVFKVIDIAENGALDLYINKNSNVKTQMSNQTSILNFKLKNIITKKTKLVALTHVSNVLGTINPIKDIVREVKSINPNCLVFVDGAQAVPHMKVDVQDLGCDFYAFSSHKMLGPTGAGVLWAKEKILKEMAPFQFGGEMIDEVEIGQTTFQEPPHKFEAGTPAIAQVIGLGAAVDYLEKISIDTIRLHEKELVSYALQKLAQIKNAEIYGPRNAKERGGVIAFNLFLSGGKVIHPHDIAQILDEENICIRAGHHCAMPLHKRLDVSATARMSFYIYNDKKDIDFIIDGLEKAGKIFV